MQTAAPHRKGVRRFLFCQSVVFYFRIFCLSSSMIKPTQLYGKPQETLRKWVSVVVRIVSEDCVGWGRIAAEACKRRLNIAALLVRTWAHGYKPENVAAALCAFYQRHHKQTNPNKR